MKQMADTFYTKIPTLSDSELLDYVQNCSKYKFEAVKATMGELRKRGYNLSADDLQRIQENFSHQTNFIPYYFGLKARVLRFAAITVLVVGLCSSVIIYLNAPPPSPNPLGYDPLDTKKSLRALELYGGTLNVLATEFTEWFDGLWHGKELAFTLAFITVALASFCWFLATHPPSDLDTDVGGEKDSSGIGL